MSDRLLYVSLGALWTCCLLIMFRTAQPMLQGAWTRLNHRRDILDPPVGIWLVSEAGSRQQIWAEFGGRRGWSTRIWVVNVPDDVAPAVISGDLQLRVDKLPKNSAVVFRGQMP